MADRPLEIRLVVSVEDDVLPEITLDDFIADLHSAWLIEEMGARWASGQDRETT